VQLPVVDVHVCRSIYTRAHHCLLYSFAIVVCVWACVKCNVLYVQWVMCRRTCQRPKHSTVNYRLFPPFTSAPYHLFSLLFVLFILLSPSFTHFWKFPYLSQSLSLKLLQRMLWQSGASIPMGRGTCPPNIYEGGDVHGNVPPIFGVYFSSNSNNCCLSYFNANIMCSFTKKSLASGGLRPPRPPTGAPPLDPTWGLPSPRPPVFFYVPQ